MSEGLFTITSNKTIKAYDLYGKEHQRKLSNFKFRASVYGVLIEDNKVLLKRHTAIGKLLLVEDSFFTYNGEDAHGILIFYEVEKIAGNLITN